MVTALHTMSWACLFTGSVFCVIGGIGLLRLPDLYSRAHAGGVTDTLGAGLILIGLALQAGDPLVAVKLLLILAFLFFSTPTSGHALARAAFSHGMRPLCPDQEFDESLLDEELTWEGGDSEEEDAPSA